MSAALGVIQQFLHPPVNILSNEAVVGNPYSVSDTLYRTRGPVGVDAFGIRWETVSAPPGYGVVGGAGFNTFSEYILTIFVAQKMADGIVVFPIELSTKRANGYLLFEGVLPDWVYVQLAPGLVIDFYWMVVF